tara:strand:+ start:317 stop:1027 length:711 start_codon:yes stop_codon:yes gene_type:complete
MSIKAIILAAGKGSRLGNLTKETPKCLLEIPEKKIKIIDWQIKFLRKNKIKDILVVTGFESNKIKSYLKNKVRYKYFANYNNSNNLMTMHSIKEEFNESFICIFSDLIFEEKILKLLIKKKGDIIPVIDKTESMPGTMRIKTYTKKLKDIGSHIPASKGDGNFIGMCKFSKKGSLLLKKELEKINENNKDYYTLAIKNLIKKKVFIDFLDISDLFWQEIDDVNDYKKLKTNIKFLK